MAILSKVVCFSLLLGGHALDASAFVQMGVPRATSQDIPGLHTQTKQGASNPTADMVTDTGKRISDGFKDIGDSVKKAFTDNVVTNKFKEMEDETAKGAKKIVKQVEASEVVQKTAKVVKKIGESLQHNDGKNKEAPLLNAQKVEAKAAEECGPECLTHLLQTAHAVEHGTLEAVTEVYEAVRDGMKEVRYALSNEDKPTVVEDTKKANKLAASTKDAKASEKTKGLAGIKDWLKDIKKMSDQVKDHVKKIAAEIKDQVDGGVKQVNTYLVMDAQQNEDTKVLQFSKHMTLKHSTVSSLQACMELLQAFVAEQEAWYSQLPLPPALAKASAATGKMSKTNEAKDEFARMIKPLEDPVKDAQKQMKEAALGAAKDIGSMFKSWAKGLKKISKEVAEQVDQREHPEITVQ